MLLQACGMLHTSYSKNESTDNETRLGARPFEWPAPGFVLVQCHVDSTRKGFGRPRPFFHDTLKPGFGLNFRTQ
jgi:hypothetical protein